MFRSPFTPLLKPPISISLDPPRHLDIGIRQVSTYSRPHRLEATFAFVQSAAVAAVAGRLRSARETHMRIGTRKSRNLSPEQEKLLILRIDRGGVRI
jgi:hypothetical protein